MVILFTKVIYLIFHTCQEYNLMAGKAFLIVPRSLLYWKHTLKSIWKYLSG